MGTVYEHVPLHTPHAKSTHSRTPHSPSLLAFGVRVFFLASQCGKRDVLPNL